MSTFKYSIIHVNVFHSNILKDLAQNYIFLAKKKPPSLTFTTKTNIHKGPMTTNYLHGASPS